MIVLPNGYKWAIRKPPYKMDSLIVNKERNEGWWCAVTNISYARLFFSPIHNGRGWELSNDGISFNDLIFLPQTHLMGVIYGETHISRL